jgi:branched-chain amino acid transport system substrate-binding protein
MMVKAFDFAFQQVNYQVAGKQIQIVVGDSQGQAEPAVNVAKNMVQNDNVSLLVGPMNVGEILAVANYANQVGIPQLLTTPASSSTLDPQWKWTLSFGGIPGQYSSVMGAYAYEQAKLRKIDVITGDWADGHEFLNAFMAKFKSDGGQIVQEQYTPEPSQDFATYLTGLKDADAVAAWYPGGEAITFLTQYHEMGIDKRMPLLAAFNGAFVAPFVLGALQPADAAATIGDLLPTTYTPLLDNPLNKQFVADYQAKYGTTPDDTIEGAYAGGLAVIQALKATGGDASPDKLLQALLAINIDTPQGSVKMDPQNHGVIYTMNVCKVAQQGNAYVWQPVFTYNDVPSAGLK